MKKLISLSIPCRNEEENIEPLCKAIIDVFNNELPDYDYKIQFIDNASDDGTRAAIERVCKVNPNICAIYNAKNFGPKSGFYGLLQTTGDCTIALAADFQDPVELIPQMVKKWEAGAAIVCAVKTGSQENKVMFLLRTIYYKLLSKFSDYPIIEHFTGYGLYDRSFVDLIRGLDEPCPYMRGLVAELGYDISIVNFVQPRRRSGKSKNNLYSLFNIAMMSFATYTKLFPRLATLTGSVFFILTLLGVISCGFFDLVLKVMIPWSTILIIASVFIAGAVQLVFLGLVSEYILFMNERIKDRPLVVEKKRINMGGNVDVQE